MISSRNVLITGAAGFIGFHMTDRLLSDGWTVTGIDNLNSYYDPSLKSARLRQLDQHEKADAFRFIQEDIGNQTAIERVFEEQAFDAVINLAAQAGVRYSLSNPHEYVHSNITGFLNILEGSRQHGVKLVLYASSSSVYGGNDQLPYSEAHRVEKPLSMYGVTKRTNELMAYTYSHLYGLTPIGLRFFTVYGPWGRPDMSYYSFVKSMEAGENIPIFNHGRHKRSFTYIGDIVESIARLLESKIGELNSNSLEAVDTIYNIGGDRTIPLMEYVHAIESAMGRKAKIKFLPHQPGDMEETASDCSALIAAIGYAPSTSLTDGLKEFVDWYRSYHTSN